MLIANSRIKRIRMSEAHAGTEYTLQQHDFETFEKYFKFKLIENECASLIICNIFFLFRSAVCAENATTTQRFEV